MVSRFRFCYDVSLNLWDFITPLFMFITNIMNLKNLIYPLLNSNTHIMFLALLISCLILLCFFITKKPSCKVYLLDFACFKPPNSQKCTKEMVIKRAIDTGYFSEKTLDFMRKTLERCGIGDSTYLAEIFFGESQKYTPSMKDSRKEVEMAIFGSIDMLLAKTCVRSEDIGILIVNCCIYNTNPSLSSMIVNRYTLRDDVVSYNLVGMGCSAGLLAIGLAKQLLQVHQNTYALIVSTESITENCYIGQDPSKFIINCLFRVGGAAMLLSNRPSDHRNSKYRLLHTVQNNTSRSDRSYNCIFQEEDNVGTIGVTITKDLITSAIATIEGNLTTLGHLILPITEKFLYLVNYIARNLLPGYKIHPYVPNYSKAVDHFLPHVGGRPVLDELQKTLQFSDAVMEASRMTLYRYGNTSSSSIWYELAYVEAKGRVKKGDRIWQMAFGSGFKCSSVIWRAMKTVDHDDKNPWTDEIAGFPVALEECEPMPVMVGKGAGKRGDCGSRGILTRSNILEYDFACYKPPVSQKCTKEVIMKKARDAGVLSQGTLDFMKKTLDRSGLGDSTYLAEICFGESYNTPSMKDSRRKVEMAIFRSCRHSCG
ncbi:hypothetical protein LXL04_018774 [Taraxacum kok-saghyz]